MLQNDKKFFIMIIRNYYLKINDLKSCFDEEYIKAEYHDVFWESNLEAIIYLKRLILQKKVENYKLKK